MSNLRYLDISGSCGIDLLGIHYIKDHLREINIAFNSVITFFDPCLETEKVTVGSEILGMRRQIVKERNTGWEKDKNFENSTCLIM